MIRLHNLQIFPGRAVFRLSSILHKCMNFQLFSHIFHPFCLFVLIHHPTESLPSCPSIYQIFTMASSHLENTPTHHSTALGHDVRRFHTGEMEIGVTEAVQAHISRQVVAQKPVSQRKLDFEASRPRFLREMMAEATGVFFYV